MIKNISTVILCLCSIFCHANDAEVLYTLDFTQNQSNAPINWLNKQGFIFELDAENINYEFDNELGLKISTTENVAGLIGMHFPKDNMISDVDYVELEWGVTRHPLGANWEADNARVALASMFFFGTEKIDSGLPFGINSAPYFISPFLANKEPNNKVYTGTLYQEGGRYISIQPKPNNKGISVTRINLKQRFKKLFNKESMPPISTFAFQMNTTDTQGGASAFLRKVTFIKSKTLL